MASDKAGIDDLSIPILIVDDNVQYAQVLQRILKSGLGYSNITLVENPKDALALILQDPERFKLMFVDYNFPSGETGGELLVKLKNDNLLEGKIAFLITSEPTVENMKQALGAGAMGIVAKPFDRSKLEEQLEKAKRSIKVDIESF